MHALLLSGWGLEVDETYIHLLSMTGHTPTGTGQYLGDTEDDTMLPKLVLGKMKQRDLSLREAAKEIGVSHTTVARVLNGDPVDADTLALFAGWLRVPLRDLLEVDEQQLDARAELGFLLGMYPKLEPIFLDLFQKIADGELDNRIIDEIVAYIKFRTGYTGSVHAAEPNDRSTSGNPPEN